MEKIFSLEKSAKDNETFIAAVSKIAGTHRDMSICMRICSTYLTGKQITTFV